MNNFEGVNVKKVAKMSTLTLAALSFMLLLVATVQGVPLKDHEILKKLSLNNRLQHLNRINQLGDTVSNRI